MRFIKRFLIGLLGLMAILAISLFSVYQFRKASFKELKIPVDAQSMILVKVDHLALELFNDALTNPSAYLSEAKDSTDKDKIKPWQIGLDIPSTICFFQTKEHTKQLFSFQKVSNSNKFKAYLYTQSDSVNISTETVGDKELNIFSHKKISVIWDNNKALITLNTDSLTSKESLLNLFNQDQTNWKYASEFGRALQTQTKADILYLDNQDNYAFLDFSKAGIHLNALYANDLIQYPKNAYQVKNDPKNLLIAINLNADLSKFFESKKEDIAKLKLPVDSIQQYLGGFYALQWLPEETLQSDTIITYGYNDNFEMEEKKELQETEVPKINLLIKASPHLATYLPEKLYYKFNKSYLAPNILLSTYEANQQILIEDANEVFSFNYQFHKQAEKYLSWFSNLSNIQSIQLIGKAVKTHSIEVNGNINLKDDKVHALKTLLNL